MAFAGFRDVTMDLKFMLLLPVYNAAEYLLFKQTKFTETRELADNKVQNVQNNNIWLVL